MFHLPLDYATPVCIDGFIHLKLQSDLQFPALETVILRDIVDGHDESTVLFLQSGPARHPCPVWSSGLRALPFLSLHILNSYAYLQPLKMAGAHIFTNAHDFAITGGTSRWTARLSSG